MNKRDTILSLLHDETPPSYIPAGFFIHFDPACHFGRAAIDKHLEYFHYTGMDFVKVQYENTFPRQNIQRAGDWANIPRYGEDFYAEQLAVVKGLVQAAGKDAPVIVTVYSPFMCAGHAIGDQAALARQMTDEPDAVKKGMEIITDSLMGFVRGCIDAGVDGFYASTQGGESFRFSDPATFLACVKPYDLALMEEMNRRCHFNILHVCDYHGGYDDWSPFLDYPGHLVNCSPILGAETKSITEIVRLFGRPYMGGVDRHGVIATGSRDEVRAMAAGLLAAAPPRYFLGADCTLPNDVKWENIRTVIDAAHGWAV